MSVVHLEDLYRAAERPGQPGWVGAPQALYGHRAAAGGGFLWLRRVCAARPELHPVFRLHRDGIVQRRAV